MKHGFWMMAACILPLALVFVLPALGVSGDYSVLLLLGGCFVMHLLMMRGHDRNGKGGGHGHH